MVSVSIDSGPIEATDQLRYVPQDKWRDLMMARRYFMHRELSYDCRCLVQFIADAEQMHGPLGFASAEDMVRQGYDLEPEEINVAVEWLRLNPPTEPLPLDRAVKLGKRGEYGRGRPKDIVQSQGLKYGTAAHWLARLDREGLTEIAAKVRSGKISANSAAVEMRWRKPPKRKTSLEKILALLPKLTSTERRQLQARLDEMRKRAA